MEATSPNASLLATPLSGAAVGEAGFVGEEGFAGAAVGAGPAVGAVGAAIPRSL